MVYRWVCVPPFFVCILTHTLGIFCLFSWLAKLVRRRRPIRSRRSRSSSTTACCPSSQCKNSRRNSRTKPQVSTVRSRYMLLHLSCSQMHALLVVFLPDDQLIALQNAIDGLRRATPAEQVSTPGGPMEDSFIQVAKCLACQRPLPKFNLADSSGRTKVGTGSGALRRGFTGGGGTISPYSSGLQPLSRPPSGRFMADGTGTGEGLDYSDLRWRNVQTPEEQELAVQGGLDGVRHIGAAFPKRKFAGSIPHTQRSSPQWKLAQMAAVPSVGEFPGHTSMAMSQKAGSLPSLRGGMR
jgi:hypothetical protein